MSSGRSVQPLQSQLSMAQSYFGDADQPTSQIRIAINPVIDTSVAIVKLARDSARLASQLQFGSNSYELHKQELFTP